MTHYPAYIQQLLAEARAAGQWYGSQADAAAKCYDVLALFPDHREASELIYALFCDPWLIYDNRVALQQQIDEWDDRPWQQRRRAALSFRFMSRWEGWLDEDIRSESGPPAGAALLNQAKGHLISAYCLGDEASGDAAWPLFVEAMTTARDPLATMLWVAACYADMGFFADAAEVLMALCARDDSSSAAHAAGHLLAEVCWWRDNVHRLPWLPPPGDGTRYWRMMAFVDPQAASDDDVLAELRARAAAQGQSAPPPLLDPYLERRILSALPRFDEPPTPGLVDWSFLDADDGQPGDPPPWAQRMLQLFPGEMAEDMARRYRWTRTIPPPDTPRRYNPDEPPASDDGLFDEDDWLDDGDDWHGGDDESL